MRLWQVSLVLLCLVVPCSAMADGMMFIDTATREKLKQALINEPEQKAVIFFDKGEEQLIISPSYDGAPEKFAWVVPVPTRPKVEITDAAIFRELAELAVPKRRRGVMVKSISPPERKEEETVKLLERRTVGKYDASVLSSTEGSALMDWLSANGYHVPKKALEPIRDYVKRHWTFVACRVIDSEPGTAEALRNGTLAPLKLTFRTGRAVYPLKLSSANPEPFDLLVYIVVPVRGAYYYWYDYRALPERYPLDVYRPASPNDGRPFAYLGGSRRNPSPELAKLSPERLLVFQGTTVSPDSKVEPSRCKQDLYWNIVRRDGSKRPAP